MTLAPPRPQSAPPVPGGVEPTVTAVVVTRRDPRGLAHLLEAVLTQTHAPDAVLVLDRTAGATLPAVPGSDATAPGADAAAEGSDAAAEGSAAAAEGSAAAAEGSAAAAEGSAAAAEGSAAAAEGSAAAAEGSDAAAERSAAAAPPGIRQASGATRFDPRDATLPAGIPQASGATRFDPRDADSRAGSPGDAPAASSTGPRGPDSAPGGGAAAATDPRDAGSSPRRGDVADASAPAIRPAAAPSSDLVGTAVDVAAIVDAARSRHAVAIEVREVDPRTPARAAVHRALLEHDLDGEPTTLAWVLPVGTVPGATTLGVLVDTWRRSPSTGIVGPKHLDAQDAHRLRALAIHATRGGRLLPRPAPGEPDQGQYDRGGDALAVPFAGALVERDLLVALRGWETSFGDVAADLDLGWRAHGLGRRVVVAASARMRTEAGVAVATASTAARRRAARRVALARAPWWIAPLLAAWIAVTSVAAAAGLLLLKRPRAAWAELSSLASLDPVRGTTARWRTRHRREVGRRDLRALFEPRRAVLTGWGDAVHDALVSPRPPIGDAAHDLNPRSWFVKVARHPGVLAVVGALGVTVLGGRSLGRGVVSGLGSGLTGGELVGTRADAGTLWASWTQGWTGAGLGGPDPVGPQAPLLALPTWLVAHVPLLPSPSSPAGLAVGLLVLLGMPLAATSAFVAFRTVVASRPVRGLAAFAWATTGVASASVAQGRLGAVVALVLLPLVASGLWLVATRHSTATSAFATALAGVVLGAFAPVLLAVLVALALVLALLCSRVRLHALVIAVVPVAVLAPWLVRGADASWPVLVAGAGLGQWGGAIPEPWQLALLNPGGPGAPLVWVSVPFVAVAVLALFRGRTWRTAGTSLALLAPVLLAAALVAPTVRLGTVPAGVEGAGDPITLWSGALLLPLALVLVLALARGLDGIRLRPRPVAPVRGGGAASPRSASATVDGPDSITSRPATGSPDAESSRPHPATSAVGGRADDPMQPPSGAAGGTDDNLAPASSAGPGVEDDVEPSATSAPRAVEDDSAPIAMSAGRGVEGDGEASGDSADRGVEGASGAPAASLGRGHEGVSAAPAGRGVDGRGPGSSSEHGPARTRRGSRGGRVLVGGRWAWVVLTVSAVLVLAAGVAWSGLGGALAPWSDPRPAVAVEQAEGAFATRSLFVSPGDSGAGYRFIGREASEVVRPLPAVADADGSVADRVSTLLGDASAGPQLFSETATDLLAVRSGIVPEVTRRLDASEGLQRVAPREGWEMWRVSPTGSDAEGLVAPPRLRLQTPDGSRLVETTGDHAATRTTVDVPQGSRLVVAEPTDWAEHATVTADGIVLEPVGGTATPTYALPIGESDLRITVNDPLHWWHLGQLVAFACLAFLAVPFGRRASRVGQR